MHLMVSSGPARPPGQQALPTRSARAPGRSGLASIRWVGETIQTVSLWRRDEGRFAGQAIPVLVLHIGRRGIHVTGAAQASTLPRESALEGWIPA